MFRKAMILAMSLVLALAIVAGSFDSAEARRGRGAAIAEGLALGLFALGAAGAFDRPYARSRCYKGPRECRWVPGECFYNRYGDRFCEGGFRECWRPTYCD